MGRSYHLVNTDEGLDELLTKCKASKKVGLDTETTGLDVHEPGFQLAGVSLAHNDERELGYYIPVNHLQFQDVPYQPENVPEDIVRQFLGELFEGSSVVMHNAAYDRPVLKTTLGLPFNLTQCDDTMTALHLVDENGRQSLKERARQFLGIEESKKKFSDLRRGSEQWWDEELIIKTKVDAISQKTGRRYKKNEYYLVEDWLERLVRDYHLTNSGAESIKYVFDYWKGFMSFLRRRNLLDFKGSMPTDFRYIPCGIATRYAGDDAINTLDLWRVAVKELNELGLRSLYEDIEKPVDDVMIRASYHGITISPTKFDEMSRKLSTKYDEAKREALRHVLELVPRETLIDGTFNTDTLLGSSQQKQKLLFDIVGFKPVKTTKSGNPSTDAKVLEELLKTVPKKNPHLTQEAHGFIRAMQATTDISKIKSTYAEGIPKLADELNTIHPSFNVTGTVSGRMSSNKPNFQNMPRLLPEELEDRPYLQGIDIREGLVAPPGHVFCGYDYTSMEVVICAALSGDENMKRLLEEGADMHAYTARNAFNVGWDLPDKEFKKRYKSERQMAKAVNFGIIYGATAWTLMNNLGISEEEAQQLIDGYFKAFPKVKEWMDAVYQELDDKGQVVYPEYGYIKRMDIRSWRTYDERRQYMAARRSCQNALIQGYSAFIVKEAIVNIDRVLRERRMRSLVLYQIHDEIGVLAPEEEAPDVMQIMRENMERDVQGVALNVEGEVTRTMSKSAENVLQSLAA